MHVRADEQKVHQSPLYPPGTRGIPASSVSNPAVVTARFSDGEKRQIVSRLGFAPHDTQSVFQARHRKRAPGAFSPCFPTGSTKLSFLEPTASSVLILAASRENTKQKRRVVPDRMHSPFLHCAPPIFVCFVLQLFLITRLPGARTAREVTQKMQTLKDKTVSMRKLCFDNS